MSFSKFLIPLSYINEACHVSLNIDEKKVKPHLEEAQEDLRELLGAEFYEEIETQYSPSGGTFTTDNETLYEDYLKKFLAWQSYFYSLGFSQSESTPTGERAFKDDNSDLLADVALFAKEKNIKRRATKYKGAIINYLRLEQEKDSTKFPLWVNKYRDEFQFGISAIGRENDDIFAVNKAVKDNE